MNTMDIETQLELCLQRLAEGATLEECLADFPSNRPVLEPLLLAASDLSAAAPLLPTPDQINRMQAKVLRGLNPPTNIARFPNRLVVRWGLLAAGLILILGGIGLLTDGDSDQTSADVVPTSTPVSPTLPTNQPTAIAQVQPTQTTIPAVTASDEPTHTPSLTPTLLATDTATIPPTIRPTDTSLPPATFTVTVAPQPTENIVSDETELAVYVDITGPVTNDGQVKVAGVPIVEPSTDAFTFASGEVVTVSGLLLDDGQVMLDMARRATPDEQANVTTCPPNSPQCDPVLLIVGEALDVEYAELAALNTTGLGKGEIARIYLLAEAGAGDVATLIARRAAGASWRDLMTTESVQLGNGVNLGNGKGQTMRQDDDPLQPGNSENAPGQANRPTARPSNNGNGNGNNGNGNGNNKDK